jgi:hypothetical protein
MIKITIVGAHGVGKSFLRDALFKEARNRDPEMHMEEIREVVRKCPFPVNEESSVNSSFWIVTEQINRELDAEARGCELLICDRMPVDPIIYLMSMDVEDKDLEEQGDYSFFDLQDFAYSWAYTYDHIIYVKPHKTFPIEHDGFRMTKKPFQLRVDEEFESYFYESTPDIKKKVIRLSADEIRRWSIPRDAKFSKLCDRVFKPGKSKKGI